MNSLKTLGFIASASLAAGAHAAPITWSTPTDISGDADVSTNGAGVLAYNAADSGSQTVNGVTFSNDGNGPTDSYEYTEGGVTLTATGLNGDFSPFTGFGSPAGTSGDYAALLNTGAYDASSAGGTVITFAGLTPGSEYEIQFWVNDSRTVVPGLSDRTQTLGGTVDTEVAHKQYVIGTFTADGTSQTVEIVAASSSDQFNAIQLRDITIPEPTSLALLGLGGLLITARRRRG